MSSNIRTDNANCGACGVVCATGSVCAAGMCATVGMACVFTTTVTFPTSSSAVGGPDSPGTLGSGGGGVRNQTGDYVEQSYTVAGAFTRLRLNFRMSDLTSGCAVGQALSWNVLVNGTVVGTYGYTGGTGINPRSFALTYTFASRPAPSRTGELPPFACSPPPSGSSGPRLQSPTAPLRRRRPLIREASPDAPERNSTER